MGREIKFRVFDKEENKYFEPIYETYKGRLLDLSIGLGGDLIRRTLEYCAEHESKFPDRYVLEQFIGLQDRNGKDIYEGQIREYNGKIYIVRHDGWRVRLERNLVYFGENEDIVMDEDIGYESILIEESYFNYISK